MRAAAAAACAAIGFVAVPACAQAPTAPAGTIAGDAITVSGRVAHQHSYSTKDLAALPQASVDVPASGAPHAPTIHLTGVLLWPILDAAGWTDTPGRKTHLQHVVLARGKDGYAVAISIAELDPGFEGKQAIVAMTRDGKPLDHPELIIPGDRSAGRRVKDLAGLEVQ